MAKQSDILNDTLKRVTALENNNLDEAAPIARITKVYGEIQVTATITVSTHQYNLCGESTICSESLIL
jgi:hypothetical protein